MKILGGVAQRDAGTVRVAGQAVEITSPLEASKLGIEFIHQELSVLDNLDVAANIFLRREPTLGGWLAPLKLIDRQRIYAEADVFLRKVGLNISSRTQLSQLSIAQQQQVEIARALSAGARIVIMDEPTSSLTLSETKRLLELIKELKAHDVSVIYISHRLDEVQEIADRVGKVWGLGSGTAKDPGPWEGEQRNMWKPTQQDNLWFHGGNLHQSRHYSLYLALQLKARYEGIPTPVYGLQEVHHLQ